MKIKFLYLYLFFFLFTINISLITSQTQHNDDQFRPINILIDSSLIQTLDNYNFDVAEYKILLDKINSTLSQIIYVEPITNQNPIKLDFNKYFYLNISQNILNGKLKDGISDYDVILLSNFNLSMQSKTNITVLNRDEKTKRPTLGYLLISYSELFGFTFIEAKAYYLIHYIIKFLGFSYDNFQYFKKNGINLEVYYTKIDNRSNFETNYIKTEKVLSVAKLYFNCSKIEGIPLENQEENKEALWDSRILLGDIMGSQDYTGDQVISEFTLALLEDSGWYQVNYYTGGLMRFGKNKGCDFLFEDCSSSKFKNEFCSFSYTQSLSCSSGRQTLTYCNANSYSNNKAKSSPAYYRYTDMTKGAPFVDYCIINDEINGNKYAGLCKNPQNDNFKFGNLMNFAISSNTIYDSRESLASALSEKYSNNSFCTLVSIYPKNSQNENSNKYLLNMIHPLCYEMYCSNDTLTIGFNHQYVACPRSGGKVEIKGDYKGYIYCPDYNLICTGTVLCNDMFDCIEKKSLIKNSTYYYDYDIKTSQIQSDLINDTILIGYEINTNGKCRQNCSQCFDNYTCFACRENYHLVGDYYGQNITEIKCIDGKDISKKYFTLDGIFYYPCLLNCEKCNFTDTCQKCDPNYYFIRHNRTFCDTGKNLTRYYTNDNGISYFPCDENFPYCETCSSENICTKCQNDFYFLSESHDECEKLEDKSAYYTLDRGITYLLCADKIPNCFSCLNSTFCTKCENNYYMIGNNKNRCYNDYINNFDEFFTEDGGISYFPCDTSFSNCLKCNNRLTCTQCKQDYDFIRGKKEECFTILNNRTYIDINDEFRYPCYDNFPFCDKCSSKATCFQCFENYSFTYDYINNNNNKIICDKIDIKQYYLNPQGVYELCNKTIQNCEQCSDENNCNKCRENYYFLREDKSKCLNDLDIRKYYSENNWINVYPCDEAMTLCEYCNNKTICEKCYDNYYLYKNILNNCIEINNLENFYKKGISYYPCNESIINCNKCSNENSCYECTNNLVLIYQQQNICREENTLINDRTIYKYNETFYMKCSDQIEHCSLCEKNQNEIICTKCEDNYVYINENKTQCVNIEEINANKDEYIRINSTDYYTCDFKGVKNCLKCKNLSLCDLCQNDYAFRNNNFSSCFAKADMEKGYYHDINEFMYHSCLQNCDVCNNNKECIQCKENFISFENNKFCGKCDLNISYINNNLTQEFIKELIFNYINLYENTFSFVDI